VANPEQQQIGSSSGRLPSNRLAKRLRFAFCFYIVTAGLLALLMSLDTWWIDVAYAGIAFAVLFVFSVRALLPSRGSEITRYGPWAAYPASWRRWLTDDFPENKSPSIKNPPAVTREQRR
jgi:hypothetical protein